MVFSRLVTSAVLVAFAPIALGLGGCGGSTGQNAASHALKTPELPTDKQAKCKVAKSQSEPLIVEWPDAARGRLESVSRKGLVAVRYEGCELSVLSRCTVKSTSGGYGYSPITRKQSKVTIKDADELYASMPVGAVKLEGKLQSAGQLEVQMTIVGRYESSTQKVYRDELEGECSDATHVIAALTVGAFTFTAGADAEVGGGATVMGAGGGAKSTATRETIQHDGDATSCTRASTADKAPPEGCGALLQIEVMPLAKGMKPAVAAAVAPAPVPAPARTAEPPPQTGTSAIGVGTIGSLTPPKCKRGERLEDGVCVKIGAKKTAPKPSVASAAAPKAGGVASAAVTCAAGQHSERGRCVDDEPPPPEPSPRSEPPVRCASGSHLENGACVVDATPQPSTPPPYDANNGSAYGGSAYGGDSSTQPQPEVPNPWRSTLAYLAIATGLSGATLGYIALGAASTATENCNSSTKTCAEGAAEKRSTATTMAVLADICFGVTALSVLGIFLLPAKTKVGVAPSPHGVMAGASGSF